MDEAVLPEREIGKKLANKTTLSKYAKRLNEDALTVQAVWKILFGVLSIMVNSFDEDFVGTLLNTKEKRVKAAETLSKLVKWSTFIPFKSLSIQEIVETKFQQLTGELNQEIDLYAGRNYDITFNSVVLFLTAVTLIIT